MTFESFRDWFDAMGDDLVDFNLIERIDEKLKNRIYYENVEEDVFTYLEKFSGFEDGRPLEDSTLWDDGVDDASDGVNVKGVFYNDSGLFLDNSLSGMVHKVFNFSTPSAASGWSRIKMVIDYPETNDEDSGFCMIFRSDTRIALRVFIASSFAFTSEKGKLVVFGGDPANVFGMREWKFEFNNTTKVWKIYVDEVELFSESGTDSYEDVLCGQLTKIEFKSETISDFDYHIVGTFDETKDPTLNVSLINEKVGDVFEVRNYVYSGVNNHLLYSFFWSGVDNNQEIRYEHGQTIVPPFTITFDWIRHRIGHQHFFKIYNSSGVIVAEIDEGTPFSVQISALGFYNLTFAPAFLAITNDNPYRIQYKILSTTLHQMVVTDLVTGIVYTSDIADNAAWGTWLIDNITKFGFGRQTIAVLEYSFGKVRVSWDDRSSNLSINIDNIRVDWLVNDNSFKAWFVRYEKERDREVSGIDDQPTHVMRVDVREYPISLTFKQSDEVINLRNNHRYKIIANQDISDKIDVIRFTVKEVR